MCIRDRGCTLASAIAANMALGAPLEEAVMSAREFVYQAIKIAPKLGQGNGPLNHGLVSKDEDQDETPPDTGNNPFAALKDMT